MGQVLAFASQTDIASYFGDNSQEALLAGNYFLGFDNSHKKPGSLLIAQYNQAAVAAYLRSGQVSGLSIPQLQSISGTLIVSVDGYVRTASSLNLVSATSFSAAAGLIATALNAGGANPNVASYTAAVAATTNAFTGSIAGNLLTVTAVSSGVLVAGTTLTGTGISAGTKITGQISSATGTNGGVGVYTVDINQVAVGPISITGAYGTMTVASVASGTISVGQTIAGSGVVAGTKVTQLGSGTGLAGTYFVDNATVVASGTITSAGSALTCFYDSVQGTFVIKSGITGAASSVGYASGTTANALNMQLSDGAILSQGSAGQTPAGFMDGVIQFTQDWATFMTLFDPDFGSGNTQKMAFAQWNNTQQNSYAYVAWDTDIVPTEVQPDDSSLGQLLNDSNTSGTFLQWAPDTTQGPMKAAFICGTAASIDFTQHNGRITFAFRQQSGLFADVTNQTVAHNLGGDPQSIGSRGNFYNFYGAYATRNDQFVWENRGFVSGPFLWFDSYINQIWLNNALQLALMVLLQSTYSIPYNQQGYALIEAACLDPINDALNFGAIRAGITLSQSQIAQINSNAGLDIAATVQARGWYLQISDASPQVRAARASPPCTLWYTDGQSVQAINLASIEVQ